MTVGEYGETVRHLRRDGQSYQKGTRVAERLNRPALVHRLRLLRNQIEGKDQPRAYLSGPMTGLPYFNFHAFEVCAGVLRDAGWFVFSPRENDAEAGIEPNADGKLTGDSVPYKSLMAKDLHQVCSSDAVIVMPGWEYSEGCLLEVEVAHRVNVPVFTYLHQRKIKAEARAPHEFSSRPQANEYASLAHLTRGERVSAAKLGKIPKTRNRREHQLRARYGMTLEDYARLLQDQGGSCAICQEVSDGDLYVDHDHATNQVRGLLCPGCNTLAGHIEKRGELLQRVGSYLSCSLDFGSEWRATYKPTGGSKGRKQAIFAQIPMIALVQEARVHGFGVQKYPDDERSEPNWRRGMPWSWFYDACMRHLLSFWSGESINLESGLSHLAHARWMLGAMMEYEYRGIGKDDRVKL